MAGEAAPPDGAEYRPPFCSSPACRLLSSAAFIGSGIWVFSGIHHSQAGFMWRLHRKMPHLQLFLSVGLVSWGLVILIQPRMRRNE